MPFVAYAGDALDPDSYANFSKMDAITCSGLTEFIGDDDARRLFRNHLHALKPGGLHVTTSTGYAAMSDWMMRTLADLHTHYRSREQLTICLNRAGFANADAYLDQTGLQAIATRRAEM